MACAELILVAAVRGAARGEAHDEHAPAADVHPLGCRVTQRWFPVRLLPLPYVTPTLLATSHTPPAHCVSPSPRVSRAAEHGDRLGSDVGGVRGPVGQIAAEFTKLDVEPDQLGGCHGRSPDTRHLMLKKRSAPISAPKPVSVTR